MEDVLTLRWMFRDRTAGGSWVTQQHCPTAAALLLLLSNSIRLRMGKGSSRTSHCFPLFFETSYSLRFIFNLCVFVCARVCLYGCRCLQNLEECSGSSRTRDRRVCEPPFEWKEPNSGSLPKVISIPSHHLFTLMNSFFIIIGKEKQFARMTLWQREEK